MATREQLAIAQRVLLFLDSTQRDLRSNAQVYLAEVAAGYPRITRAQLGEIVHADGAAISALMARMGVFFSHAGRQAKAVAGLSFYGITGSEVNTDRLMIKDAADVQAAADVSTDEAIIAAANATLAAIPAVDNLE